MYEFESSSGDAGPVLVSPQETITITGDGLLVEHIVMVARQKARVSLANLAHRNIDSARRVVEGAIGLGQPVYGLNTDVGPFYKSGISADRMSDFQLETVLGHAIGHGTRIESSVVRAMMLARVNGIARGGAGVRKTIAEGLVNLINNRIHPVAYYDGSIGQSDLSEMAQIAGVLVGVGEVEFRGQLMPAAKALRLAGLHPVNLEPKEAIALISCNGYTLGLGAHIVYDAALLLRSFDIAAALSLEGFAGNPSIIHDSASRLKPHPGHIRVATRLRALLKGSCLYDSGIPRNLQDPLSFRCIPQVHGVFDQAWNRLKDAFYIELNSAGDNPLVSSFDGTIFSVGNFDVSELALSLDTFKIALAHAMQLSSERIQKHLWAQFSGLPTALADKDVPASKLIPLGRTAAALASEARGLAFPVSLTYQSAVAEGIEDYASMAPCAARKTAELIGLAQKLVAIELMVAARAVELRRHTRLGEGTARAFELVRAGSRLDASVWKQEFARVEELVADGRLVKSVTANSKQERPAPSPTRSGTADAISVAINKANI